MSVEEQATDLFQRFGTRLRGSGCGWSDVVLIYLWLSDMSHYAQVNKLFLQHFPLNPPARYVRSLTILLYCQLVWLWAGLAVDGYLVQVGWVQVELVRGGAGCFRCSFVCFLSHAHTYVLTLNHLLLQGVCGRAPCCW